VVVLVALLSLLFSRACQWLHQLLLQWPSTQA
jgi:hypothetical protein